MTDGEPTPLEWVTLKSEEPPERAVIWLHGLGADGNDFAPLFRDAALPRTRVILPHAPVTPVTVNGGMAMRAWYDIRSADVQQDPDLDGIRESAKQVSAVIAGLEAEGIAAERIVIGGFSQGGVMALWSGLGYPRPLAGIAALSGYLPAEPPLAEAQRATPVFMAHGRQDSLIPCALGEAARDRLAGLLGRPPRWRDYSMDHGVNEEEAREVVTWLKEVLGGE